VSRRVSIDRHAALHREILHAERMATYALATMKGKTAEQVAAEVASRAVDALKRKEAAQPCTP
jgi:hypothetical protein